MTVAPPRRAPGRHARVATPRTRGDFPALDGLRIVAVTAVVGTHAAFATGRYSRGAGRDILAHLDIGVAIFFVISGFLISREWLTPDRETGGLPRLLAYARRRALRILPLYWLSVLLVFTVLRANRERGAGDWLRHLALLQGYGSGHLVDSFTQTWSLGTEVSFYAVLPAIAWVALRLAGTRTRLPLAAVAIAGLLGMLSLAWVVWFHLDGAGWLISAGYWLPTTLSWFMAGTVLAAVRVGADTPGCARRSWWSAVDRLGDSPGVCLVVAACSFGAAITPLTSDVLDPFPSAGQALARTVLYLVTALALVLPAVLGAGRGYDRFLGHPVLRYLGRISYSVFLLHLLVLRGVSNVLHLHVFTGSFLTLFGLTWLASVAVSAVSYRLVERPAVALGRRRRSRAA